MSEWTAAILPDGKTEGSCTLSVCGITVNVSYTRPAHSDDMPEKLFTDAFYELVCEGSAKPFGTES